MTHRISPLLLSMFVFTAGARAQEVPLVYDVENTGAVFPEPVLPEFDRLPAVRPLPDPFQWSDGSGRSTAFSDWSHRRAEIKAEIEHYGIGKKPPRPKDIAATYKDRTLTVNVTENDATLTLTARVQLPEGEGPFPAVIGIGFGGGSGILPGDIFTRRNIAGSRSILDRSCLTLKNGVGNRSTVFIRISLTSVRTARGRGASAG